MTAEAPRFTGYLGILALLVAASAASSALSDFAMKQAAARAYTDAEGLVRFFALLYTGTSLVGFVLQAGLSRRLLDAVGVGGTLAVPPALGILLCGVATAVPALGPLLALRGSDLAVTPSLFRTSFEPLFAPIPAATKRRAKQLIDVAGDKTGDALAALSILALGGSGLSLAGRAPIFLATLAYAAMLYLAMRAKKGYVAELHASLASGTVSLDGLDKPTRMTLSTTTYGVDRLKLLEEVTANDPTEDIRALLGPNPEPTLRRSDLDPRIAPFVIPHLATSESAVHALRAMGADIAGLLADVLLSEKHPLAVRRRIPHVLRVFEGESVARTLALGLSTEPLEVRYRSALALADVAADDPSLVPDRKVLFALVKNEKDANDHVFALLSLAFGRATVELVRHGLRSEDHKLRGIAMEYLSSMVPEDVLVTLEGRATT